MDETHSPKRIKWGYGPLEGNKLDAPLPLWLGRGRSEPKFHLPSFREGASIQDRPRLSSMHGRRARRGTCGGSVGAEPVHGQLHRSIDRERERERERAPS